MDNKKLAKKGRHGDTHIRDVYGIKSHVNKDEAKLIDLYGLLGEMIVSKIGAGTINPKTNLPEYHGGKPTWTDWLGHPAHHGEAWVDAAGGPQYDDSGGDAPKLVDTETGDVYKFNLSDVEEYDFNNDGLVNVQDMQFLANEGETDKAAAFHKWYTENAENIKLSTDVYKVGEDTQLEGMPDFTAADFEAMSPTQLVDWVIKYNFDDATDEELKDRYHTSREEILHKLNEYMPKLQEVDQTQAAIYAERYGAQPGTDGIWGTDDDIVGDVGPGPDGLYGTEDDTGGTRGRAAGITYGAAGRTYETAGIAKETMLSGLQDKAYEFAPAVSTGVDLRGQIAGKGKIKKAFETGMDVYDIAGKTYGAAGETYDLAGDVQDTDYWEKMYGLEKRATSDWETQWSSFLNSLTKPTTFSV